MAGFKGRDTLLSAGDAALAKRTAELVGQQMRQALAEDRLIRTGQMPETFTNTPDGIVER